MAPRSLEERGRRSKYPLYSTTFVLHRVSPLYIGDNTTPLNNEYLSGHARRFRDILKGDVLRGVHIYSEIGNHQTLETACGLKECRWTVLEDEQAWTNARKRQLVDEVSDDTPRTAPAAVDAGKAKGILVEIVCEKITYQAILLCDPQSVTAENDDGFSHLPLLLTRMPNTLRTTFLDYLASNFDTRISQMKLPANFLPTALERFFTDLVVDKDRLQRSEIIKSIVGDVQITFKFSESVTPLLKTFDFDIPKADLPLFLSAGQKLLAKSQSAAVTAGRKRKRNSIESGKHEHGPFHTALSSYLTSHMALDLSHPGITISKIACGAFVLGAEGKMKLFSPAPEARADDEEEGALASSAEKAMQNLVISVMAGAKSKRALRGVTRSPHTGRQGVERGTVEQVDVDLPPPYELHDPSRATML